MKTRAGSRSTCGREVMLLMWNSIYNSETIVCEQTISRNDVHGKTKLLQCSFRDKIACKYESLLIHCNKPHDVCLIADKPLKYIRTFSETKLNLFHSVVCLEGSITYSGQRLVKNRNRVSTVAKIEGEMPCSASLYANRNIQSKQLLANNRQTFCFQWHRNCV